MSWSSKRFEAVRQRMRLTAFLDLDAYLDMPTEGAGIATLRGEHLRWGTPRQTSRLSGCRAG